MGRVVDWMARTALEANLAVTLVAASVAPDLVSATNVVHVRAMRGLPALADTLAWCGIAARAIRRTPADVVHVHLPPLLSHGTVMTCHHLAQSARTRGVRERGQGLHRSLREVQMAVRLRVDDRCYMSRSPTTRLSFVSELLREEFRVLYGAPRDGAVLFPPAPSFREVTVSDRFAARGRLGLSQDALVVGYLGGNDPRKGFEHVLALANDAVDVKLDLLIAGPNLDGVAVPRGHILGYVDPDAVIEASDVIVAPALFEAAGLVVGQALARGVPVVVGIANGWAPAVTRYGAGIVWDGRSEFLDAVLAASRVGTTPCRLAVAEVSEQRQAAGLLALYERSLMDARTARPDTPSAMNRI